MCIPVCALPEGTQGELVFTSITKQAFPLLRYRTRDICILRHEDCPCGRTHIKMCKPMGRSDDMMIIRGVNVFPSQVEDICDGFDEIADWYQIELTRERGLDVATMKVEINPGFPIDEVRRIEDLQHRLKRALKAELNITLNIKIAEPHTIERSTGKAVRIVDLRE